ncbi:hypothetical protein THAOC_00636 [Thalassiosira oceanica]|uniref:Uncharacterized protein n=1 Tax=Thalassiosira oceanica TaxID=159749 RepID=K0TRB9_THAOC|nr:hypothetical protein THAOC_00636 [Thalassiosira oceanica]|eukprot:EJK77527.1 hypothetical protein THAOC_00636 [Thalassiosira oceanica]
MPSTPVVDLTPAPSSEDIARVAATAALASQQALAANQRVQSDVNGPRGVPEAHQLPSEAQGDEEVIEKEKEDQEDFDGANWRTTEDVKNHRKKFALFLPQNGDQLVVCLNTYTYAASKIVGSKCDHLVQTKAVTKKIQASPTFRNWNKRQEVLTVLWAVHTDSRSFFRSPGDDLPQLIRAPLHGALKRRGGGGVGSGFQKGDQDDQQRGTFSAGSGMPSSPDIHPDFQLLLEPLTEKYGHLSVDDICHAANTPSDNLPYLSIAGSARNMCYQHLLGECKSRECRQYRYHATTEELDDDPNFRKALSEKLKPGVIKLVTDAQGSRKRVWEQT